LELSGSAATQDEAVARTPISSPPRHRSPLIRQLAQRRTLAVAEVLLGVASETRRPPRRPARS
jgi:hypothetical protein